MKKYPESIDILYFIEHADRELSVAKAISNLLKEKHGLKMVIVSQIYDSFFSLMRFKPKVVVTPTPSFSSGSAGWMFHKIYGNDINYVSLNYEQFLGTWESASKLDFSDISKCHQKHFAWGQNFYDILVSNGIDKENIYLTGRPINSIIQNELKANPEEIKYKFCDTLQVHKDSKFYFFALTDGIAFLSPELVKSHATRGFSEEKMILTAEYIRATIKVLISWLAEISKLLNSHEYLVLRPHPSVSEEEYLDLVKQEIGYIPKNLIITKTGNAQEWLSSCEIYFTNYSTLLLDADAQAKPSFIIDPIKSEFKGNYWWCAGRNRLTTENEFKEVFSSDITFNMPEQDLNQYFEDGLDAIDVSSSLISSFCKKESNSVWKYKDLFQILSSSSRRVFGSLLRKILMLTNISLTVSLVKKGLRYDYFKYIKNW